MKLETARLRLRPCTLDELDDLCSFWTDPDVRRYLWDDQIISREKAEAVLQSSLASFPMHGFGLWTVTLTEDDALIGVCSLRNGGDPPEVELIYGITPAYWGQGLATEAAQAVLRYGFKELHLARIVGGADVPNVASLRVLEKLGMTFTRRMRTEYGKVVSFALTREALQERKVGR